MKIFVCIKQVPDINAPIHIKNGQRLQDGGRMVLNAYDASAVEEALVLTEKTGGEVEVVLIGPESAKDVIRKALAMGADKGTHIMIDGRSEFDSAVYADILAGFFSDKQFDYIACGKQSQDTDAGLTGSMLAEKLNLPYATNAVGITASNDSLTVRRQGDLGQEILEIPSPGLITCSNDMNEPRIPTLKGIMQSKKKPVNTMEPGDFGMDPESVELKVRTISFEEKPVRQPGRKFDGEPDQIASTVTDLLKNEAGVL